MKIQVVGLHRSGTNFVEFLVRRNHNTFMFMYGDEVWQPDMVFDKHSLDPHQAPAGYFDHMNLILVVYKNALSWVESIAFRDTKNFDKVIKKFDVLEKTSPELTVGSKNLNLINVAKTYNYHMNSWLLEKHYFSDKIIPVSYESLLDKQNIQSLFLKLADLGLERKIGDIYVPPLGSTKNSEKEYPGDHLDNYKYNKILHLTEYQIQTVLDQLSPEVKALQYVN